VTARFDTEFIVHHRRRLILLGKAINLAQLQPLKLPHYLCYLWIFRYLGLLPLQVSIIKVESERLRFIVRLIGLPALGHEADELSADRAVSGKGVESELVDEGKEGVGRPMQIP
jgi:hypothetical protein